MSVMAKLEGFKVILKSRWNDPAMVNRVSAVKFATNDRVIGDKNNPQVDRSVENGTVTIGNSILKLRE